MTFVCIPNKRYRSYWMSACKIRIYWVHMSCNLETLLLTTVSTTQLCDSACESSLELWFWETQTLNYDEIATELASIFG